MTAHPKCVGNIGHLLVQINELYTFVFGRFGMDAANFFRVVSEVRPLEAPTVGKLSMPALETPAPGLFALVTKDQSPSVVHGRV